MNGRLGIASRKVTADMALLEVKDYEAVRVPLPPHTIDLLTQWQAQAPEKVPYILLEEKHYRRVTAKWQKLRSEGKPWRNRYMVNNAQSDLKKHAKIASVKLVGKLTISYAEEELRPDAELAATMKHAQ